MDQAQCVCGLESCQYQKPSVFIYFLFLIFMKDVTYVPIASGCVGEHTARKESETFWKQSY